MDVAVTEAGLAHQVFRPHANLPTQTGLSEPQVTRLLVSEANFSYLPPEHSHRCAHIQTEANGVALAQANHRCCHALE